MRVETPPSFMLTLDNPTEINCPRKELVHGLIETRRTYVLSAPNGFGKSNIARHLAYSVASVQPFLGFRTHKSRVVGGSYAHGRIDIGKCRALPIVRGANGEWTLDVYRVTKAFDGNHFLRKAAVVQPEADSRFR